MNIEVIKIDKEKREEAIESIIEQMKGEKEGEHVLLLEDGGPENLEEIS